jgi:hypothetical protein
MTWGRVLYIAPPCRSVCGKIIQEMEPTSRRRSYRTKSLLAKNAETPPIPTLLSATEVNALIFPHLQTRSIIDRETFSSLATAPGCSPNLTGLRAWAICCADGNGLRPILTPRAFAAALPAFVGS